MLTTARPESYSCMPASKMPTTVKRLMRGTAPIGDALHSGANTVTLSPVSTPSVRASSMPSTMP